MPSKYAYNLGATRGKGSSTRIYNYCVEKTSNPSGCIQQFININNTNNTNNIIYNWSVLGASDFNSAKTNINRVVTDNNENVYAAGLATSAGANNYVFIYNNTSWSTLGNQPAANHNINDMIIAKNNQIYITGWFSQVRTYNGISWVQVGQGFNSIGNALAQGPDEKIYVGGAMNNASGNFIAYYNGTSWVQLGTTGFNQWILILLAPSDGKVYAAGRFTNGATSSLGQKYVAVYDGTTWSQLGSTGFNGNINTLAFSNGKVYAAGTFTNGSGKYYVAVYDGTIWSELGTSNFISSINSVKVGSDGKIYAAGNFTNESGRYVAVYDGTSWSQVGTTGFNNTINSITIGNNRNIYAGGNFTDSNGYKYVSVYK
jgi:hypothetical protein